jgi:small subunit ribosomal protein S8
MSMSDPIADMLARIRNGQKSEKATIKCPDSKMKRSILDVLKFEGYIGGYTVEEIRTNINEITIELRYYDGRSVIQKIDRKSKPGRRVYSSASDLPKYYNGMGISVLSTSKGVMSDSEARTHNIGGEILFTVF